MNECGDAASGDAVIVVFEKLTSGLLVVVVGFGVGSVLELFFKLAEFWAQIHIDTTGPVLHPRWGRMVRRTTMMRPNMDSIHAVESLSPRTECSRICHIFMMPDTG